MHEWHKQIQEIVEEIDICIKQKNDEALTLAVLAEKLGYSEYYVSRKFKEISGMNLREYVQFRGRDIKAEPVMFCIGIL